MGVPAFQKKERMRGAWKLIGYVYPIIFLENFLF